MRISHMLVVCDTSSLSNPACMNDPAPGICASVRLGRVTQLLCLAFMGLWSVDVQAGYTHYYSWHKTPDAAALKACVAEMNRVIEVRKDILVGAEGEGAVDVESERVEFNGHGENSHEPFLFPGEEQFNFCKTAGKPYDEVVTACLLVAITFPRRSWKSTATVHGRQATGSPAPNFTHPYLGARHPTP